MRLRFTALVLLFACRLCAAQAPQDGAALHWVATWGTAQQLAAETLPPWVVPPPREPNEPPPPPMLPPYPQAFRDETVRMIVRASIGGDALRLTLSNALGMDAVRIGAVHVALRQRDSAIVAERCVSRGEPWQNIRVTRSRGSFAGQSTACWARRPVFRSAFYLLFLNQTTNQQAMRRS